MLNEHAVQPVAGEREHAMIPKCTGFQEDQRRSVLSSLGYVAGGSQEVVSIAENQGRLPGGDVQNESQRIRRS